MATESTAVADIQWAASCCLINIRCMYVAVTGMATWNKLDCCWSLDLQQTADM